MNDIKEYGKALFMLTEECGVSERVYEDIEVLLAAVRENPRLIKLLDTPAISKEERLGVIDASFSSLHPYLVNLVKMLCQRRMTYLVSTALLGFKESYDKARGIERVEAITAVPLTEEQLARLKARLEKKTGKTVIITNVHDPDILGGIKLRYMGIQLDDSLKTRLEGFERSLRNTVI